MRPRRPLRRPPPLSADEARKIAGPRRTPLNTRSRGESVRVTQLQTVLNRMGYDAGPADGRFGGRTADALRDLQRNYAVARSGRLDAATLTLLDDLSAGRRPQVAGSSRTPAATPNATDVSAARRDTILPLDALAGIMRARKRYKEATEYYTRIIDMLPKPERQHWTYWYARGTSYERLKQWPLAERDLKMALSLNKDQPLVLNYLGYSWIDQNRNLRQGLKVIERAVVLKSGDGYIVDSLGWAHYRLGNFKTAVTYLEKAVELRADDPTLNDHLGDALWQVGRRREARFQWEQALTLNPEAEDEAKIRAKLQNGLVTPRRVATPARRARAVTRQSSAPTARAEN